MTRVRDDLNRPVVRPQRRSTQQIVRLIGILGRVFVGAGLILLFYTGYLLWGTGVYTKEQQNIAKGELVDNPIVTEEALTKAGKGNVPPARPDGEPQLGQALFSLKVPRIGLETAVFFGVGREELKKGPGLFPTCPVGGNECVTKTSYPGEDGNVAISGHRTTYGSPFFNLQDLSEGDTIDFVSGRARYRYVVRGEEEIVDPVAGFENVEQHGKRELTLTTCHPRFSAAQRLIIHADFESSSLLTPIPADAGKAPPIRSGPQAVVAPDVLILAGIAVASALGSLGLSKRYRGLAVYIALGIVGAAGLWVGVFPRILALMPANY